MFTVEKSEHHFKYPFLLLLYSCITIFKCNLHIRSHRFLSWHVVLLPVAVHGYQLYLCQHRFQSLAASPAAAEVSFFRPRVPSLDLDRSRLEQAFSALSFLTQSELKSVCIMSSNDGHFNSRATLLLCLLLLNTKC